MSNDLVFFGPEGGAWKKIEMGLKTTLSLIFDLSQLYFPKLFISFWFLTFSGFVYFFLKKTYKPKDAYITHKIEVLDETK